MARYFCWEESEWDESDAREFEAYNAREAAMDFAKHFYHANSSDGYTNFVVMVRADGGQTFRFPVLVEFEPAFYLDGPMLLDESDTE